MRRPVRFTKRLDEAEEVQGVPVQRLVFQTAGVYLPPLRALPGTQAISLPALAAALGLASIGYGAMRMIVRLAPRPNG